MMIQTSTSDRSIETTSSICSDDPAMKRTRTAPARRRSSDLGRVKAVPSSRKLIKTTAGGLLQASKAPASAESSAATTPSKSKRPSMTLRRSKREVSKREISSNDSNNNASPAAATIKLKMKKGAASRKRKVRFSAAMSQVVCIIDNREDMSIEEKEQMYMSTENVQQIREDAKFVTKYFRSRNKEVIAEIDESYCNSLQLATHNFKTADDFTQMLRDDNAVLQKAAQPLYNWCCKSKVSGRGLERYCSAKQRAERGAFAAECRQAVLRLCENPGIGADDVGQFYNEYARSCALFSRMMGQQDEEAAQEAYRQMARKERAMARSAGRRNSIQDIVVKPPSPLQAQGQAVADTKEIVLPPLEGAASDNKNHTGYDRRNMLLKSKSSSARLMVECLSDRVGSNRVLGDPVQI